MARGPEDSVKAEITEEDLHKIAEAVKEEYNFDFQHYAFSSFARRIKHILSVENLDNIDDLITKIQKNKDFFKRFLNEVTVNTTELFRDPEFWVCFRKNVLPKLKDLQNLYIWHAGCSTGMEVYSLAITLLEEGFNNNIRVLASDINTNVIENAKKGAYPKRLQDGFQQNYIEAGGKDRLDKYYKLKDEEILLDTNLLKNVTFQKLDLVQDLPYRKFDLIFCRNVLIYFDRYLQDLMCKKFHDALLDRGYLILGAKESLVWCSMESAFHTVSPENKIYQLKR